MFCYNCGTEISQDAKFCLNCGRKIDGIVTKQETGVSTQSGLDHRALTIYLEDVRILEYSCRKLENKIEDLINSLYKIEWNLCWYYNINDRHTLHLLFDGTDYFIACLPNTHTINTTQRIYGGYDWIMDTDGRRKPVELSPSEYGYEWVKIDDHFNKKLSSLLSCVVGKTYNLYDFTEKNLARKVFIKSYKNFKGFAPQEYNKRVVNIKEIRRQIDEVYDELERARAILDKAYNINIIPKQHRNLYTVHYLCEYIGSSTETLSAALLNFNLTEIKQKLDVIIDQQQEMILNQCWLAAQNDQIIKQNQEKLQSLANIEQNTDRAAQYAQIAANNAEACAWIGIANYIKN